MINVAVLVSGGGTNLQALIDAEAKGQNPHGKVKLVLASNPQAFALERAKEAGIDTEVLVRRDFATQAEYDAALVSAMEAHEIDVIVLAGFMTILSAEFIFHFENRILNVHPSLIPSFCGEGFYGLHVHEAALARGVKVSGATVHFVNAECDGGPIIAQKAVEVAEDDTPKTLQKRIMEQAEWVLLPQALAKVCEELDK